MISQAHQKKKKGQVLKSLREKAKLSRIALAVITDLSTSTICRIENGKANDRAFGFAKVCEVFGIYPEQVLDIRPNEVMEDATQNKLENYLSVKDASTSTHHTVRKCQERFWTPARLVNRLLEDGFFNEYRKVREIREEILCSYKVNIGPSTLSNALKSKKTIQSKPAGKSMHKLYKATKSLPK